MKKVKLINESESNVLNKNQLKNNFNERNQANSISSNFDIKSVIYSFSSLIDDLNKLYIKNPLFNFFQFYPLYLFILLVHLWLPLGIWENNSSLKNIFYKFNIPLSFSFINNPNEINKIGAFSLIFFYVIMGILFSIGTLEHKINGRISKTILFLLSITFQCGFHFSIIPFFNFFGSTFQGIKNNDNISRILFYNFLGLLSPIIFFYNILCTSSNYLTNPNTSLLSFIDGSFIQKIGYLNGILIFSSHFGLFFGKWFSHLLIIISIFINIYLFKKILSFPYSTVKANEIVGSLIIMIIFMDLLTLLNLLLKINFSLYISILIITFFISNYFLKYYFKKKNFEFDEIIQKFGQKDILELLKIKKQDDAFKFINLGLINLSPIVLNGEFLKLCGNQFNSFQIWLFNCKIMALLPGQHEIFSYCLKSLKCQYTSSIFEKIQLIRLIKLEKLRFMSEDVEKTEVLKHIKIQTMETISIIKNFWKSILLKNNSKNMISEINNISSLIIDLKRNWRSAIDTYKNESFFAQEYSIFLIECLGKFEKGVFWGLKSSNLKAGFQIGIDELFRSFVISRPELIKNQLVN